MFFALAATSFHPSPFGRCLLLLAQNGFPQRSVSGYHTQLCIKPLSLLNYRYVDSVITEARFQFIIGLWYTNRAATGVSESSSGTFSILIPLRSNAPY